LFIILDSVLIEIGCSWCIPEVFGESFTKNYIYASLLCRGAACLRRYSQTQSPGSSIPDFIKDDSFVLISCQSGSFDLGKEICSLIGLHFFLSLGRASFHFIK
jgi:hypothetical protein